MKWKKIEEYFKGNYDWVLVKYYDVTGYECIPTVMEFNKADGKWHYDDKDYTALEDICLKCEGQCRMTHKGGCAFRNIDNSRCDNYEELEEYMKTVKPNFNSHIEKGTIEMNNEFYNLMEEKMARLINENQKYKEVMDKAIRYIEKHKKTVNTLMAENTNLRVGTFMWNVDKLLDILKEVE